VTAKITIYQSAESLYDIDYELSSLTEKFILDEAVAWVVSSGGKS